LIVFDGLAPPRNHAAASLVAGVVPHVLSCFATGLASEVAPCLGEDEREVCAVRNAPDVVGVLSDVHSQWLTGRTPAVRGEGMACS
jgi:hypothetical protein